MRNTLVLVFCLLAVGSIAQEEIGKIMGLMNLGQPDELYIPNRTLLQQIDSQGQLLNRQKDTTQTNDDLAIVIGEIPQLSERPR